MRYTTYSSKLKKYWGGNGFTDIPELIEWEDDPMEAQKWADGLNLSAAGFDHEKVQRPKSQVHYVVDENGDRWTPPPFKGNKYFAMRVGEKVTR